MLVRAERLCEGVTTSLKPRAACFVMPCADGDFQLQSKINSFDPWTAYWKSGSGGRTTAVSLCLDENGLYATDDDGFIFWQNFTARNTKVPYAAYIQVRCSS
jgi:hypothetical protein